MTKLSSGTASDCITGQELLDQIKGVNTKKVVQDSELQLVRDHINSFPRVQSHYHRAKTSREYMEAKLNLAKMYDLYKEECRAKNQKPVKVHVYRDVFNSDFNIAFMKPKKDRCDSCEAYAVAEKNGCTSPVLLEKHEKHVLSKLATYNERKNDRSSDVPVVCFDLENVISLPHANVSSMFYKRKLSMYNLTGHLSCGKQAYSVLWHEGEAGRGGNDIASALTQMLYAVVKQQPAISELILWADSCVPQNRHSLMSLALIRFLSKQTALQKITQKF